jgi:hypothetical protein
MLSRVAHSLGITGLKRILRACAPLPARRQQD